MTEAKRPSSRTRKPQGGPSKVRAKSAGRRQPKDQDDHLAQARAKILAAALPNVPFDGWTSKMMRAAASDAGIDLATVRLAFPSGVIDLVDYFCADGDRRMLQALEAHDLASMKIRERITFAVRTRIEVDAEHREAVRRASTLLSMPFYARTGTRAMWRTADAIWRAAGDTSTDFNHYTKRIILSGVLSATMLFWFGDESEEFQDTWAFLDRRIQDVMQIEKVKAQAKSVTDRLPDPFALLGRLRYPG